MGDKKEKMGTVIILHGWSYSTEKWRPFLKLLDQNRVGYEMPKIPGLTAPLNQVWSLDDYVSWLHKQMAKNQKPKAILGHSNGGRIAAAFAAKYPEKVSELILIDSAGIIRRDLKTLLRKSLFATAAKIGRRLTNSGSIRNLFYKAIGKQDYNKADPTLKKTMLSLISHDLEQTFAGIKVSTLIIWGEDDKVTPLLDGKKILSLIHESKLKIIKNAKHSPQFSHPEELANLIINYLQDLQDSTLNRHKQG